MTEYDLPQQNKKIGDLHGQVMEAEASYGAITILLLYHPAATFYNRGLSEVIQQDFQVLKELEHRSLQPQVRGQKMPDKIPTNKEIADVLEQIAELLEMQDANRFRIQAYRDGAKTVRDAHDSIADVALEKGEQSLQELSDIGEGLARVIASYVRTGHSDVLEQLKGEVVPESLFERVPDIGKELAQRIVQELDISTLPELEQAAHDGRLEKIEGFGSTKVRNVQVSLAGMLSTSAQRSMQKTVWTLSMMRSKRRS